MTINTSHDVGPSSTDGDHHQKNNENMTDEKSIPHAPKLNPHQADDAGYSFQDVISGQFDADEESAEVLPAKRSCPYG